MTCPHVIPPIPSPDCALPLQVFEFMASDLEAIIKDKSVVLSPADIKSYMLMLLKGLAACHSKWVIHRCVKQN